MNAPDPARDGAEGLRGRFEEVAPVIVVDPDPVIRRGRRRRATARGAAGLGVVAAVLAVAMFVLPGGGTTGPAVTTPPPPEPSRPVAVEVIPGVVAPGDVVMAVLVASEENDLTFGVAAEVERWDGREWRRAGVARLCLLEWECVGTVTDRLEAVEGIGLGAGPGTTGPATVLSTDGLSDGWYRLVQRAALDEGMATGVFRVRTGAPAAPPLPPRDDVRLIVDPVLVPPEGGLARVVTHVPAGPDGTLTAEDIERVDSALSPSALVQRWDGARWVDDMAVKVWPPEADLGPEWGSRIMLHSLEEGLYRLTRTRAGMTVPSDTFAVTAAAPALPMEEPEDWGPDESEMDPAPQGSEVEPGDPPVEDVYSPDHPRCQEQPARCLLEAWWRDVVAQAGVERAGGDHDIGPVLTDSVRMAGQRYLMLTLFPAAAAPEGTAGLTVESTTRLGDATIEAGRWDDGADGRRVTCGGFVLHARSTELVAGEIDHVIGQLARAMSDCPADLDALAARYPEIPAV